MSAEAREAVLAAMRAALGTSPPPAATAPAPPAEHPSADLLATFLTRLRAAGGACTTVGTPEAAGETALRVLREHGATLLFLSDSARIQSLLPQLAGCTVVNAEARDAQLGAEAGITTADLAIADTGTLVLCSGAERHRIPSLLPPLHIALLERTALVATLGAALDRLRREREDLPAALTFITGPSRTADIELTLVVGVHGPRALHVIILDREAPAA